MDYYSTFTPLAIVASSYSSPTKPNSHQDDEQQHKESAECRLCESEAETDACNYSSISSEEDEDADTESTADSDTFFHTAGKPLNYQEDDDLLEACSCTTGDEEMPDMYVDDHDDESCRGAKKELESYEDEIRKGKIMRKREEDKAFWEACLAYGY